MQQIKRMNRIREELQLCHADGTVALTVNVDINTDDIAAQIRAAYEQFEAVKALLNAEGAGKEQEQAAGEALLALFRLIFGPDDLQKMLAFYDGREAEMLLDVFPFVRDEILLKVFTAANARKSQIVKFFKQATKTPHETV